MKLNYRCYKPNQGLEKLQAEIYSKASGNHVTADQIRERYEREKIDPKTVRYILTEEGMPLAYIQARDYRNEETHIGYPWALPDCPLEAQKKIFEELLTYIQNREKKLKIFLHLTPDKDDFFSFVKEKGFVETDRFQRIEFDLKELSKEDNKENDFFVRKGTIDDLDILVKTAMKQSEWPIKEERETINYFKDKVIPDDHLVLVFKDDQLIAASAPLLYKQNELAEEQLILRFHFEEEGHKDAWKPLLIGVAEECVNTGLDSKLLMFYDSASSKRSELLKEFNQNITITTIRYSLQK